MLCEIFFSLLLLWLGPLRLHDETCLACGSPLYFCLGASINMAIGNDAFETTLDKLTKAGSEEMKILLKNVCYDTKQIKTKDGSREFTKVTDKEGNGMYYELRGKDKQMCERQLQTVPSQEIHSLSQN